jgi:hypothetical protein
MKITHWMLAAVCFVVALGGQAQAAQPASADAEITLPADMFEGEDPSEIIKAAKEDGVSQVIRNADGSYTYKIPKAVYNAILKKAEDSILGAVNELKSGRAFKSIKGASYNKDFTEFTLVVDRKAFESSLDTMAVLALGVNAASYHLFGGVPENKLKISIRLKDQATNTVFKTLVYPDALNP